MLKSTDIVKVIHEESVPLKITKTLDFFTAVNYPAPYAHAVSMFGWSQIRVTPVGPQAARGMKVIATVTEQAPHGPHELHGRRQTAGIGWIPDHVPDHLMVAQGR